MKGAGFEYKFIVEEVDRFVMAEESNKATVQDSKSDTVNARLQYKKNQRQPKQSYNQAQVKEVPSKCHYEFERLPY